MLRQEHMKRLDASEKGRNRKIGEEEGTMEIKLNSA